MSRMQTIREECLGQDLPAQGDPAGAQSSAAAPSPQQPAGPHRRRTAAAAAKHPGEARSLIGAGAQFSDD
eukprot:m51a1_g2755 hypothetical protein (70) ;mRNA; f:967735-967944